MNFKVGQQFNLFLGEGHPNNDKFEIRTIKDDMFIVKWDSSWKTDIMFYKSLKAQIQEGKITLIGRTVKEFYGIAMWLSDDSKIMLCLLQEGTGNTIETSKLEEHCFPYSAMKKVITNKIDDEHYVMPQQFFKVIITEEENKITYEFFKQDETNELVELFKKPDYFKDLDTSFLFDTDEQNNS